MTTCIATIEKSLTETLFDSPTQENADKRLGKRIFKAFYPLSDHEANHDRSWAIFSGINEQLTTLDDRVEALNNLFNKGFSVARVRTTSNDRTVDNSEDELVVKPKYKAQIEQLILNFHLTFQHLAASIGDNQLIKLDRIQTTISSLEPGSIDSVNSYQQYAFRSLMLITRAVITDLRSIQAHFLSPDPPQESNVA